MIEIDKVYNMDCLNLMREMANNGQQANLLLTDIPYNAVNRQDNGLRTLNKNDADILTFDLTDFLQLADKCIKSNFVIFCGREQISDIYKYFTCKGYTTRLLVWEKSNPSPMNGEYCYLSGIETAVYAKKKGGTFNAFCKNTVFKHNSGIREIHPTQKPLSLWYELLGDLTNENDLVLDTCMGSFTTAVACHKMQRHFIGAELDKEYFALGQKRLQEEQNQISMFDL